MRRLNMQKKVDYAKVLEESKVFVDKLGMEMVPYAVARQVVEELSAYKIEEALDSVSEALNGYFKQVDDLQKDI